MKVLVTSARLPHALGLIRGFGEAGHEVHAADTFRTAPGLHSKYVTGRIITESPAFRTRTFVGQIADYVKEAGIDLVVPAFEEVFYLSRHLSSLGASDRYFWAPLEVLARLHDKQRFVELAQELGLPMAETVTVKSDAELRDATRRFDEWFARAAFSRGGVALLTNTGPLAGAVKLEDCHPTPEQPWLVQEFLHGEDVCSYSIAQHGRLSGHCTYQHPLTIEHAGGIVFESVEEPRTLEISKRIIEHLGYHGNISFDWMKTDDGGLYLVECNPRPTAGIFTMDAASFAKAVFEPDPDAFYLVPAGRREQIDSAIVRDMFREPRDIPSDLQRLFDGTQDVYAQRGDRLPGLYVILAYSHVFAFRRRMHVRKHRHSDLMAAQFFDIAWDGGEID